MPNSLEVIVSHCLAHARRRFVEVTPNFPEAYRHVLEALGEIYHRDELARKNQLSPEERLVFHQQRSSPVMNQLHQWLTAQLDEKRWSRTRVWGNVESADVFGQRRKPPKMFRDAL